MKIISLFFFCVIALLFNATSSICSATLVVPEIHWVRGCIEPTTATEERKAIGCSPTGKSSSSSGAHQTITVKGKNFGRSGASVSLTLPRTVAGSIKHGEVTLNCLDTKHSDTLPTLLLFCKLPQFVPPSIDDEAKVEQQQDPKKAFEQALGIKNENNNDNQKPKSNSDNTNEPIDPVSKLPVSALLTKLLDIRGFLKFHVAVTLRGNRQPSAILRNVVEVTSGKDGATPQSTQTQQKALENLVTNLNWKNLGVGGLTKEVKQLIRRVISTRSSSETVEMMKNLGLPHVKGVLLHGLPGCGKTLLARKISEHLGASHVKVVNGPSLVSKFVGESEKNLRELFAPAQADWERFGSRSPLHVIILDEVDAIMKTRHTNEETASGSTAIYDGLTTQMLAALDGLESVGNILVFALTNRKDSLDSALLRPGRFEVQLHLHLPNSKARREILEIHAEKLKSNKMLDDDVDFGELAEMTPSFSGADLAGVVRSAVSFAMQRTTDRFAKEMNSKNFNAGGDEKCSSDSSSSSSSPCSANKKETNQNKKKQPEKVTTQDFLRGIAEVRQTKGAIAADTPSHILRRGIVPTLAHTPVLERLNKKLVPTFQNLPPKSFYRILLHGAPESGLSSIAASVCTHSFYDSVQILRADSLLSSTSSIGGGSSAPDKIADQIIKSLQTAQEGNHACLVIDGADQLATAGEFTKGGVAQSMSTNVLKALRQVLQNTVAARDEADDHHASESENENENEKQKGKVLVVMTVQSLSFVRSLVGSSALFDAEEHVSLLGPQDVARFIVGYGLLPASQWKKAQIIATTHFASDIPAKRLLRVIDTVRSNMIVVGDDDKTKRSGGGVESSSMMKTNCRTAPTLLKIHGNNKETSSSSSLDSFFYDSLPMNKQHQQQSNSRFTVGSSDRRLRVCETLTSTMCGVVVDSSSEDEENDAATNKGIKTRFEKLLSETIKDAASAYHVDV